MSDGTTIIQKALQRIGAHSVISPASSEAILVGKDALNSMIEMWLSKGIDFGFAPLDAPGDDLNEPADTRNGIISNLAIFLAPDFDNGKTVVSQDLKNIARSEFNNIKRLYRKVVVPDKVVSSTLPKGAGSDSLFLDSRYFNRGDRIKN